MPRTWKAALAPFLAGIPERTGWVGEWRFGLVNDLRFGERKRPRMIDQCAALALPAGEAAAGELAAAGTQGAGRRSRRLARAAWGWPNRTARRSRSRPARSGHRSAGRPPPTRDSRGGSSIRATRSGSSAGPTRRRWCASSRTARPRCAISPAPICAMPSWRSPRRMSRCRTIQACCMSRPRSARRPSAFSDRPARGTGRRSIRSPRRWCRRSRHSTASPATSRPAACAITAACAISRPIRCWR